MLKSNVDFLSCSCTNTIHMSSMFSRRRFKVLTSKIRKRGASSSGEDSQKPHLHMLVALMTLIWKMSIWSSILKHTMGRSRDGPGILIKKARTVCAYEQEEDSLTPQFWTKVQHDAFYGHLINKSVFAHKSIDWDYLDKYASTRPLNANFKFQHIGLLKFTQFTCDWNETAITQFYATVEVDWEEESVA
jgi:hypothetical protein